MLLGPTLIGHVLGGRYRIDGPLGEGAMGQVWRARQLQLDRDVALKVLHTDGPVQARARRRLHREARLVARISHPNVVQVFDYGETDDGSPYLVMELVDGCVATERMAQARSVEEVVAAARCVLVALESAHGKGVLHRDLKPANMMLRGDDPGSLVLLDFGIAAILSEETATDHGDAAGDNAKLTREGAVVGTPLYMAPEQARGLPATERSDLYAVGVILFEWLSGRPPFVGGAEQVMRAHVFDPPPALVPRPGLDVPPALRALVERALRKAPEDRFGSASEMRRDLSRVAASASATGPALHATAPASPGTSTVELSVAPSGGASAGEAVGPLSRAPFVGRGRELAWLHERLAAGLSGRGAVLILEGEEGVGKSRLVEEALERLDLSLQPMHGRAGLTPAGGPPLHLIRAALSEALSVRALEGDARRRRLSTLLDEGGLELDSWLRGASGSDAGLGGSDWRDTDPADRALRALARRRPVLLVLDDLQWADAATLSFLVRQAGALRHAPAPIVLVALRHPAPAVDPLGDLGRYEGASVHRLPVERLSATETEALLRGLAPLAGPAAATLASRAHGSPLFAVQLVRTLQERGLLEPAEEGLRLREDVDASVLPFSLEQILNGRLESARDAAGAGADGLLHAAAVLGESFDIQALEAVLTAVRVDLEANALDDALDALVEARVFAELPDGGPDRLAWAHPMLRSSVLEKVRRSRRQRRLCRAAADALRAGSPSRRAVVELLLLAGDREAAAPLANAAADEALAAGELSDALTLYELGAEEGTRSGRHRAWSGVGTVRNHLGQLADAEAAFGEALEAADGPQERGMACFAVGRCRYNRGDLVAALSALKEADALLQQVDGPEAALGRTLVARTWAAAAAAVPGEPLPTPDLPALLARASSAAQRVEHHKTDAYLRLRRGDPSGSVQAFEAALVEARRLGHRPGLADLLCDLGRASRQAADTSAARRHLEEALSLAQGAGQHRTEAEAHNELGELGRSTGALDSAAEHYAAAVNIWQALASPSAVLAALNQALVAVAAERFAAARAVLVELRQRPGGVPDYCQVPFLLTTALAAAGSGAEPAALQALDRAVERLEAAGSLDAEGRAVLGQLRALGSARGQSTLVSAVDAAVDRLDPSGSTPR